MPDGNKIDLSVLDDDKSTKPKIDLSVLDEKKNPSSTASSEQSKQQITPSGTTYSWSTSKDIGLQKPPKSKVEQSLTTGAELHNIPLAQTAEKAHKEVLKAAYNPQIKNAVKTLSDAQGNMGQIMKSPPIQQINQLTTQLHNATSESDKKAIQDKIDEIKKQPIDFFNIASPFEPTAYKNGIAEGADPNAQTAYAASKSGLKQGATVGDLVDKLNNSAQLFKDAHTDYQKLTADKDKAIAEYDKAFGIKRAPDGTIITYSVDMSDPKAAIKNATGAFIHGASESLDQYMCEPS